MPNKIITKPLLFCPESIKWKRTFRITMLGFMLYVHSDILFHDMPFRAKETRFGNYFVHFTFFCILYSSISTYIKLLLTRKCIIRVMVYNYNVSTETTYIFASKKVLFRWWNISSSLTETQPDIVNKQRRIQGVGTAPFATPWV